VHLFPVSAGILIIITVFLPLLTLQGLEGKYFVPVAMTIAAALLAAYLWREQDAAELPHVHDDLPSGHPKDIGLRPTATRSIFTSTSLTTIIRAGPHSQRRMPFRIAGQHVTLMPNFVSQ